jgi:hypothetical protein
MADQEVADLAAATSLSAGDLFYIDQGGVPKKITAQTLQDLVGLIKARVTADHVISTIAATEVPLVPTPTLQPGTYQFQFFLRVRSATATVSPMYGVNFTGTAAVRKMTLRYVDAGGLATGTGVADDVGTTAGSMLSGTTVTAFSTTAPNMGHTGGVGATATDVFVIIEGFLVVTVAGDLELWHGSETATSTSVMTDSTVVITKC